MFNKILSGNPFKIFYVVFAYILAFSLWWAYLLYAKNETAYKEKVELNQLNYQKANSHEDYLLSDDYLKLHSKYFRQKFMIMGEGGTFIFLLLLGLLSVRKVFLREMQFAEQQRNFLLSITHELKSPLSTIKISLQTMAKRKLEQQMTEKLIGNSLVDLDRLESLVDNILFAAKIERDEPGFSNEEINVSDIVHLAVDRFSNNKKNIAIREQINPEVYLNADSIGFTSVIINLIENAVKYSDADTEVTVTLADAGDNVLLTVADQGIGIADKDKLKVFDKFYRVGNEDTRKTKGTGLGLYIVKRFVEIYKGQIDVEDNAPVGTIFKLSFSKIYN